MADHLNIAGPLFLVKYIIKFGSALGEVGVCVCVCVCVLLNYDTGRSFDPIFMKFTWLVWVHSWVNSIVFGNNWPNRTTYMGENVPPKTSFSGLSQTVWDFLRKKLKTIFGTPFTKKKVTLIFVVWPPVPSKMVRGETKSSLRVCFGKDCFF